MSKDTRKIARTLEIQAKKSVRESIKDVAVKDFITAEIQKAYSAGIEEGQRVERMNIPFPVDTDDLSVAAGTPITEDMIAQAQV